MHGNRCIHLYEPGQERNYTQQPGPTFIKPDQLDPWIKDQIKITLVSAISSLKLPNFVSSGRDKPSHMTQNCNCRGKIVDSTAFPSWSLIHRSSWSSLIKVGPGLLIWATMLMGLCCADWTFFSEEVVKQLKEITHTRHQFDDLTNRPYTEVGRWLWWQVWGVWQ